MHTLKDWFAANKLTLNLEKTVCVLFQKSNTVTHIELEVNDLKIYNQTETKFLGMWLDQHLSWSGHIQRLVLKLKRNQHLLNWSKNLMNEETKKIVYHVHISSHIKYGLILWGNNANNDQIKKIQKIQTNCLQIIKDKKANNKSDLNKELNILTIKGMVN